MKFDSFEYCSYVYIVFSYIYNVKQCNILYQWVNFGKQEALIGQPFSETVTGTDNFLKRMLVQVSTDNSKLNCISCKWQYFQGQHLEEL